jgi:hypothetical protein
MTPRPTGGYFSFREGREDGAPCGLVTPSQRMETLAVPTLSVRTWRNATEACRLMLVTLEPATENDRRQRRRSECPQ